MNATYERLINLFDERELQYRTNCENQSVCTDLRGRVGTYRIVAQVDNEVDLFHVFGYSPIVIPEGSRPAIGETVARANYGLRVGKFEMDFDDGELRFYASQVLADDGLAEDVIDRLIRTTISMLDMYLPAILSVVYGNEMPKDAIRQVETRQCGLSEAQGHEDDAEA